MNKEILSQPTRPLKNVPLFARPQLISVIPAAAKALQGESFFPAAESIMTTDRFPKAASRVLSNGSRITGIAKGAGMIEPNMATMLSYLLTDAEIDRDDLQRLLKSSVDKSYNSVSVDGDESTSDTGEPSASVADGLRWRVFGPSLNNPLARKDAPVRTRHRVQI